MAKTGHEMSILKKKKDYYTDLSDYLAKRVSKISVLSKWGFSKSPSDYKVDMKEEYARFLEKSNIEPNEDFDAMILAGLDKKIKENSVQGYDNSIEAMFGACVRCKHDALNEIAELCGIEL